jgi:hypothetical protein
MKVEMLVMEEGYRVFKSKGVEQKEYVFTGRDCNSNPGEMRCGNNLVYVPSQDDLDKFKGKLQDKRATVQIKEVSVGFNGDVRLKGAIEVGGEMPKK